MSKIQFESNSQHEDCLLKTESSVLKRYPLRVKLSLRCTQPPFVPVRPSGVNSGLAAKTILV